MLISIRYKLLLILGCFVIVVGCKTTQPQNTLHADQYFTVSLYSTGTGVQPGTKNIVAETIKSYQKKGYEIIYSATPWGREGEVDYCFELQKLDPKVYKSFFTELSTLLKDKQVHIKEKAICKTKY